MGEAREHYCVVDLGAKTGAAVDVYCKGVSQSLFREVGSPPPEKVLVIDAKEEFQPQWRRRGWKFLVADVVELFQRPRIPFAADIFLAGNFLEHLASVEQAQWVLRRMLEEAQVGVWLWMPSFEQDETGEGQLKRHGLQFSWTSWRGHKAHLRLEHVREVLGKLTRSYEVRVYPSIYLRDSRYRMVVPLKDWQPDEVVEYDPGKHGPRPFVRFDPPVVREWGVQVAWK